MAGVCATRAHGRSLHVCRAAQRGRGRRELSDLALPSPALDASCSGRGLPSSTRSTLWRPRPPADRARPEPRRNACYNRAWLGLACEWLGGDAGQTLRRDPPEPHAFEPLCQVTCPLRRSRLALGHRRRAVRAPIARASRARDPTAGPRVRDPAAAGRAGFAALAGGRRRVAAAWRRCSPRSSSPRDRRRDPVRRPRPPLRVAARAGWAACLYAGLLVGVAALTALGGLADELFGSTWPSTC